jgi:DNA-binding response OmpR family regulator
MDHILIVEDEAALAREIAAFLRDSGYEVTCVETGKAALTLARTEDFHLCLLDIGLPDCSGLELCGELRKFYNGALLMLTAYDDEDSVVMGLQQGADDYITKPCSLRILQSRIASQLRRQTRLESQTVRSLKSGDLQLDLVHRMLFRKGIQIPLGDTELRLCEALMKSDGLILPRDLLLEQLWDTKERYIEDNTLSVHVSRLRKKLGLYQGIPYIETVKGIGYRWSHEVERSFL